MRYVYVITNLVNGKVYIGQTKNPKSRKAGHWRAARVGVECHLYKSMRKYGSENYAFRVLEECADDAVDDRERFWIARYDSMNPEVGYNKESGGHANKTLAEETKRKISSALTGQHFTIERCANISAGLKGRPCLAGRRENNPEKGKNISRALTGRSLSVAHKRAVSEGLKAYMASRLEWHPSEDARRRMSIAQKIVGEKRTAIATCVESHPDAQPKTCPVCGVIYRPKRLIMSAVRRHAKKRWCSRKCGRVGQNIGRHNLKQQG